MTDFNENELAALRDMIKHKGEFDSMVAHNDEFTQMMLLRGAKKLVFQTYRGIILGTAGVIVALVAIFTNLKGAIAGFFQ